MIADYRRTSAAEAVARARAEIALAGWLSPWCRLTTDSWWHNENTPPRNGPRLRHSGSSTSVRNWSMAARWRTRTSSRRRFKTQQQQRELQEAELEMNRSRLELAVLVFPDFNENFSVVDDLQMPEPLPSFPEVQTAAANKNPELRAALAALQQANQEVAVAWNGFLPSLSLDYFYGIDANHFAVNQNAANQNGPIPGQQVRNLGYAATATLQLPIWNWGADRSKVKQADLRRSRRAWS